MQKSAGSFLFTLFAVLILLVLLIFAQVASLIFAKLQVILMAALIWLKWWVGWEKRGVVELFHQLNSAFDLFHPTRFCILTLQKISLAPGSSCRINLPDLVNFLWPSHATPCCRSRMLSRTSPCNFGIMTSWNWFTPWGASANSFANFEQTLF